MNPYVGFFAVQLEIGRCEVAISKELDESGGNRAPDPMKGRCLASAGDGGNRDPTAHHKQ